MTNLEQMLKLYTKKDLWNRIQEKQARIYELEEKIKNAVVFPKLEKAYGHTGLWYLYDLDYKGDICCTSFEATEEEAKQELYNLTHQHEDKGQQ